MCPSNDCLGVSVSWPVLYLVLLALPLCFPPSSSAFLPPLCLVLVIGCLCIPVSLYHPVFFPAPTCPYVCTFQIKYFGSHSSCLCCHLRLSSSLVSVVSVVLQPCHFRGGLTARVCDCLCHLQRLKTGEIMTKNWRIKQNQTPTVTPNCSNLCQNWHSFKSEHTDMIRIFLDSVILYEDVVYIYITPMSTNKRSVIIEKKTSL